MSSTSAVDNTPCAIPSADAENFNRSRSAMLPMRSRSAMLLDAEQRSKLEICTSSSDPTHDKRYAEEKEVHETFERAQAACHELDAAALRAELRRDDRRWVMEKQVHDTFKKAMAADSKDIPKKMSLLGMLGHRIILAA